MASQNKHVEDYLNDYCNLSTAPEFAVLIKGLWGSGKTWFINDYLERSGSVESLYISLYGITNTKEIETALISSLIKNSHEVFKSPKVEKGLKIFNSLFGDKMPDIRIIDYLPNKEKYVFVFDDLERCSININDVLGYINNFVEHDGLKVILIADESKIIEMEESSQSGFLYEDIKEKLIGETFEVKANLDAVVNNYISTVDCKELQDFYLSNKKLISKLFISSSYNNLRHLKQALLSFSRFFKILSKEVKSNQKLIKDLLHMYLVYSFEIKSGNLSPENLKPELNLGAEEKPDDPFNKMEKKYANLPIFSFRSPILEVETWEEIFAKGAFNKDSINNHLLESMYFQENNQPDWMKLWEFWKLTDEEFECTLEKVLDSFSKREYENLGEIKHVVAEFLKFSKIGIYDNPIEEIIEKSKSYILFLKDNNMLPKFPSDRFHWNTSYRGLVFQEEESQEFKDFCKFIDKCIDEAQNENHPLDGKELLKLMSEDVQSFAKQLIYIEGECIYYDIPILSYIDEESFVSTYISLSPGDMRMVNSVVKERYSVPGREKLLPEVEWLNSVKELLIEKEKQYKGKLTGYRIKIFVETYIQQAIKHLTPTE
jgi:hypothetical protein